MASGKVVIRYTPKKGYVFVTTTDSGGQPPSVTLPDGSTMTAVRADKVGGTFANNESGHTEYQWVFPGLEKYNGAQAQFSFGGSTQTIPLTPSTEYRTESQGVGGLDAAPNKALGGGAGGFSPTYSANGYGAIPAYLGDMFPDPVQIQAAQLAFTDPIEFAKKYSPFINQQFEKNYDFANDIALKELNTELKGMQSFVPAAAALKRSQTSIDNQFNQAERTRQVFSTLPDVAGNLKAQAGRASAYAEGRLPDSINDRGFELNSRSVAADRSTAGGFGASSSVARKASDLYSADRRVQLSQYGDQLITQNAKSQEDLFLAPTEYSAAGTEVKATPSVSGSQLAANSLQQLNQYSMLPISQGFQSTIQQNEFQTDLEQQSKVFNATAANDFALQKFNYQAGYAGTVAGAAQTDINTKLALDQQKQYQDTMNKYMKQSQNAGLFQTISQGIAALFGGSGKGDGIIQQLQSLFGGGDTSSSFGPDGSYTTGIKDYPEYTPSSSDPIGTDTQIEGNVGPDVLDYNDFADSSDPGLTLYSNDTTLRRVKDAATPAVNKSTSRSSIQAQQNSQPHAAPQAIVNTKSILRSAGISNTPGPGKVSLGYNSRGQEVFANRALKESNDPNAGYQMGQGYSQILSDMGAFKTVEQKSNFDQAISIGQDAALATSLADAAARGDQKAFINTILGAVKKPLIGKLTSDPKDAAGLTAAFTAAQLFSNWDKLSATQKGLALTNIGIKTYQYADGTDLTKSPLVYNSDGTTGMTVGQGLGLISAGYNTFSLVKHWDDMSTLGKIAGASGTASEIAALSKSFGLMGAGTSGAAVATTDAALANATFNTAVPQFGVGAVYSPLSTATAPEGYTLMSQGAEGTYAVPTANAGSAAGASGAEAGATAEVGTFGTIAGVASIAVGTKAIYDGWGTGGSAGARNGVIGGSAIAGGLYTLGYTNPYLMAGIMVVSIASNATKVGKSTAQMERDGARSVFKGKLADDNYDVKLADGTLANIGIDGHGDYHMAKDPSKIIGGKGGGRLQAFDVDYTNDLDYTAGLGGISLARLLTGTKATNIDQIGGQVGNAAIKNIGYGQDMTQGNFDKMMGNMRGFYSQSGIKSKADAYQLANAAFAENRISAADHASMLRTFDMMYDKTGYQLAQTLMAGRTKGLEEAGKGASTGVNINGVIREGKDNPIAENKQSGTKVVTPGQRPNAPIGPKFNVGSAIRPSATSSAAANTRDFSAPSGGATGRSKDEIIAANKNKYGQKNMFEVGGAL